MANPTGFAATRLDAAERALAPPPQGDLPGDIPQAPRAAVPVERPQAQPVEPPGGYTRMLHEDGGKRANDAILRALEGVEADAPVEG
jgi:hypothetical protein